MKISQALVEKGVKFWASNEFSCQDIWGVINWKSFIWLINNLLIGCVKVDKQGPLYSSVSFVFSRRVKKSCVSQDNKKKDWNTQKEKSSEGRIILNNYRYIYT